MASQEPVERLYVKIEADVKDLLERGEAAIKQLERELDKLDKKGKKAGRFDGLKAGLDGVVKKLRQVQLAVIAFTAALVTGLKLVNEAVVNLRIERSFYRLADAAGQSGDAILSAMQAASQGAVDNLTLMRQANLAMQLGVARTAEDFDKLTRSAIILGAAVGRGPTDAINDLIIAAGRRSKLVLDNLGLSLGEVNRLMDQFAQQDFGKTVDQLSQVQRDMLFTRATIEAANRKAEQLGGNVADAGTNVERMNAQAANLRAEFGQTALIFFTLLNNMGKGPGLLNRLANGAVIWQTVLIQIAALVETISQSLEGALAQMRQIGQEFPFTPKIGEMRGGGLLGKIFRGERVAMEDLIPDVSRIPRRIGEAIGRGLFAAEEDVGQAGDRAGKTFSERFQDNLAALEERFKDILDPEAAAAGLGVLPPTIDDVYDELAAQVRQLAGDLASDLIDLREETDASLEKLATDHADKMLAIERDLADALNELAEETAEKRARIFADARQALADLAAETDKRLADERDDFQTDERRATEDHLRDMRRLTEDYLFDLEGAVKERDARAVVDLQRRFRLEQRRREEDFNTRQGREREDFDDRLQEIRDHEAERRQEILAAQAEQLQDLMAHEEKRRRELERYAAEQRARETRDYQERQAELQSALAKRLQTIARELADEEQLNEESARRLLDRLNAYFGIGGEIDKLMQDFANRRRQRMIVQVSFEGIAGVPPEQQPVFFQGGGAMIARKPTVGIFGESGPEAVQAIPLNRLGGGEFGFTRRHEFAVDFNLHGNVPPTMSRGDLENQMAGVVLRALRDSGALSRG